MSLTKKIEKKLREAFEPEYMEVQCESHRHNVPAGAEMHFRVVLVSNIFTSLRKVQRHRKVYTALAEEMAGPVHALALHTFSPEEWAGQAPASPECLDGGKK